MFSSIRNFLNRHRRKFVITSFVFGGLYLASAYAQKKLREWQEREARKFLEMTRKKQHFESTERTCNQTILSLSKVVIDSILKQINTEEIVKKLQENPENKVELWNEMKIMIITRICVMIYALAILVVTLRVQLNIIGGYLYKDSVVATEVPLITSEVQSKYLSLCHHFISSGIHDLTKSIEDKVRIYVEPISLKDKVTLQDMEQLFWKIQTSLCSDNEDPIKKMVPYLMGNSNLPLNDGMLTQIIRETMDMLESDEVTSLTITCVGRCFIKVTDEFANIFTSQHQTTSKNDLEMKGLNGKIVDFRDINKIELYFIKLLPNINEMLIKKNGRANIQDVLVEFLTLNDKLKVLGANTYEVFSSSN